LGADSVGVWIYRACFDWSKTESTWAVINPSSHTGDEGRLVPGQPKRFAQGIGLVFSVGASIAWLSGASTVAIVLIAGLTVAASLEAFVGYCLGCAIFGQLMKIGVIPKSVCDECNDISRRLVRPNV
jgi:hypothetical protein